MKSECFYVRHNGIPEIVNGYIGELTCSKGVVYIGVDRKERGWAVTELTTGKRIINCDILNARKEPNIPDKVLCSVINYLNLTTTKESIKKFHQKIKSIDGGLPQYLKEIIAKKEK